ncbi:MULTISPECIES: DivIVA domain-containing protein [unclassified Schaalia]|uniref:DivIVA domain-containing protein n=1 Tax=unclassified Schaalia TaxID=2691889 RepID=UPI001E4706B9|nr:MULTISPECIES: DivIVA domain-containing protein [unclassified Schaalia]MCD4549325.1 DivIVA domain-containing protein [Schaalia sp. lx-260]MCD4557133.1 DivIVA domain-containing protein [Schaalia sp. lx-100]
MSTTFPRVSFFRQGYDPSGVDEFFEDAKRAYEGGVPSEQFSAEQVRRATFNVRRRGYDMSAVDEALNRLEAAFIHRDRMDHVAVNGETAWFEKIAERATTLYPRLRRPRGERFARPQNGRGYDAEAVDDLLDRLANYFDDQDEVTVDDIRQAVFPSVRAKKAYAEGPVDAYLGRAVEILLAVD